MRLVVGLGNPGARYAETRHNIGVSCLDRFASRWALSWASTGHARFAKGTVHRTPIVLACTLSWMNQTGFALPSLLSLHKTAPQDLIVVHDDMDLDLGCIRIKRDGGAGGHNGVHSIIEALNTTQFCRVKIGIGKPQQGQDPADFVLAPFSQQERQMVENVVEHASLALDCLLDEGTEAAMNRFNARPVLE